MKKTIKNIGLDVHKNSISIGIADDLENAFSMVNQLSQMLREKYKII